MRTLIAAGVAGVLILLQSSLVALAAPGDVSRWRGILQDFRALDRSDGNPEVQLRFEETPTTGGAIALRWDANNWCDVPDDVTPLYFTSMLAVSNFLPVAGVTVNNCRDPYYVRVCLKVVMDGAGHVCGSFFFLGGDIEWNE